MVRLRWLNAACAFMVALLVVGCGGARHPVAGRILLNEKPFEGKEGTVVLKPDASKGNTSKVTPMAALQRDGTFSIVTNGKPGAPLGWYKVVITATAAGANPNEDAPSAVHARYTAPATTPLEVEVVASPPAGHYDLKLTR